MQTSTTCSKPHILYKHIIYEPIYTSNTRSFLLFILIIFFFFCDTPAGSCIPITTTKTDLDTKMQNQRTKQIEIQNKGGRVGRSGEIPTGVNRIQAYRTK